MWRPRKFKVCICGGGHLGHALAAVLGANIDVCVSVATSTADLWQPEIRAVHGDVVVIGKIHLAVANIAAAAEEADLILLACPAFTHRPVLQALKSAIERGVWIGAMPAPGFFQWAVEELSPRARVFAGTRAPFNCRIRMPGGIVDVAGIIPSINIAVSPSALGDELKSLLQDLLGLDIRTVESFFAATLEPSVSIFHPARLFTFFTRAPTYLPRGNALDFYEAWDDAASEVYLRCDAELQHIAARMPKPVQIPSALAHYGVETPQLLTERIRTLGGLPATQIPTIATESGYVANCMHRFFCEDIEIGLNSVAWLCRLAGQSSPTIDELISWHRKIVPTTSESAGYVDWAQTRAPFYLPELC